jgi:hypothetical protein
MPDLRANRLGAPRNQRASSLSDCGEPSASAARTRRAWYRFPATSHGHLSKRQQRLPKTNSWLGGSSFVAEQKPHAAWALTVLDIVRRAPRELQADDLYRRSKMSKSSWRETHTYLANVARNWTTCKTRQTTWLSPPVVSTAAPTRSERRCGGR